VRFLVVRLLYCIAAWNLHLVHIRNLNLSVFLELSENIHSFLNLTVITQLSGLFNLGIYLWRLFVNKDRHHTLSGNRLTICTLRDRVNADDLGRYRLLAGIHDLYGVTLEAHHIRVVLVGRGLLVKAI